MSHTLFCIPITIRGVRPEEGSQRESTSMIVATCYMYTILKYIFDEMCET